MYSKLTLFGHLGKDPDLRYTQSDDPQPMTNVSVAVDKPVKNPDGSWGKETTWWSIFFIGRQAETICEYLHKGSRVLVEAKNPEARTYQRDDGTTGVQLQAKGVDFKFGESRDQRIQEGVADTFDNSVDEDSIPF